jgi:parallel beta-helix repeat protein
VSNYTVDDAGQVILVRCDNIRVEGLNLSSTSVGVELLDTSNSTLSGNNIANNGMGIMLHYSSDNSISGNNITANNYHGIWLHSSSDNSISGNNITANNDYGIMLNYSSDNSISGNNITANFGDGIMLYSSSGNKLFHNSFVNNNIQVYSSGSVNIWDDGYPSGGNYWSDYSGIDEKNGPNQDQPGSDGIVDTPYIIDVNNRDRYPLMIPWVAQHDVAITNVTSCKTVVSQGYSLNMNVTAANQGSYVESFFDVYVYASNLSSTYQIGLQTITLNPYETAVLTFTWDTHDLAKGNYTLWAYAEPVVNETETADNTYTDGVVTISAQGDINADGIIDIFDITTVALAFNSIPGDSNWNPVADINSDNIVDIFDIVVVALHFGEIG